MKKLVFCIGCISVLYGCSSVNSLGIQQTGKDRYTVTTNMKGVKFNSEENSALTRAAAVSDANKFCHGKGYSYANILNELVDRGPTASVIIDFTCAN